MDSESCSDACEERTRLWSEPRRTNEAFGLSRVNRGTGETNDQQPNQRNKPRECPHGRKRSKEPRNGFSKRPLKRESLDGTKKIFPKEKSRGRILQTVCPMWNVDHPLPFRSNGKDSAKGMASEPKGTQTICRIAATREHIDVVEVNQLRHTTPRLRRVIAAAKTFFQRQDTRKDESTSESALMKPSGKPEDTALTSRA